MKDKLGIFLALCILCGGCGPKYEPGTSSLPPSSEPNIFWESEPQENAVEEESAPTSGADLYELIEEESQASLPPPVESSATPEKPVPSSSVPATSSSTPTENRITPTASSSAPAPSSSSSASISSSPASSSSAVSSSSVADTVLTGKMSSVEQEVIRLINQERRSLGLGELTYDASLTKAARIRSQELYDYNLFAHTRPGGQGWQTVLQVEVPIQYKSAGENLAKVEHNMPDYDPAYDPGYWYSTWENSPTHYENMVRPGFTHVGVGIHYKVESKLIVAVATTIFATY